MSRASLRLSAPLGLYAAASVPTRGFASRPLRGWDAANPTAYWTGGASAYQHRPPPRSNRWLLHPWMPIDVRLPALVGVLGAAAYIYLDRTQAVPTAQARARGIWDTYMAPLRDAVGAAVASVTDRREARPSEAPGDTLPSDVPPGHPIAPSDAEGAAPFLDPAAASGPAAVRPPLRCVDRHATILCSMVHCAAPAQPSVALSRANCASCR